MPVSAPNIEPSPALPSPSNQVPPAEAPAAPNITYGTIVAKNVWPDPFFRILRSQSGVEYVLHQEDRPANQYLSLGHTVGFTSSGEYLESPRGMLLRATQVSQINSPIDLANMIQLAWDVPFLDLTAPPSILPVKLYAPPLRAPPTQ